MNERCFWVRLRPRIGLLDTMEQGNSSAIINIKNEVHAIYKCPSISGCTLVPFKLSNEYKSGYDILSFKSKTNKLII